jgi:hypothetical protein
VEWDERSKNCAEMNQNPGANAITARVEILLCIQILDESAMTH